MEELEPARSSRSSSADSCKEKGWLCNESLEQMELTELRAVLGREESNGGESVLVVAVFIEARDAVCDTEGAISVGVEPPNARDRGEGMMSKCG